MAGLKRYNNLWKNLFGNWFVNFGRRVDCVLWHARGKAFPLRLKVFLYCAVQIIFTKNPSMVLFNDWLLLIHLWKTVSITLTYLFTDYKPAINVFLLSHFMQLISFDTAWKHQKSRGFMMFSRGIKKIQWHEMGQ